MTGGFFAVLDDIAALLDDTATMGKLAAKKVGGVLGDDLAVNAEQASGHAAARELPVLWAITKGSFRNKLIILPVAFLLSAFAPWLIVPILMLGGLYLSYEGVEKLYEYLVPHPAHQEKAEGGEAAKIRSAVRTDFILSIEIVVIALGVVADETLTVQVTVVTLIALLATAGVYGIVALLVRMDDIGWFLIRKSREKENAVGTAAGVFGRLMVAAMPKMIRALGYIGTAAMLLVGGGIFVHHVGWLNHALSFLPSLLPELVSGLAAGSAVFILLETGKRVRRAIQETES